MPNHTIYIRKEDQPKWDAIGDKSLWVRKQLNRKRRNTKKEAKNTPPPMSTIPKPPEMSDMRWLQHLKDNGIDLADTSVDSNPDWGA